MSRSDPSKRGKPSQADIEAQKANLIRAIALDDNATVLSIIRDKYIGPNAEVPQTFESGVTYTLTPLYEAAKLNRPEICQLLLKSKAEPFAHPVYNHFPLHCACNEGHWKVVQVFAHHLSTGDLNRANSNGDTPLHIAALRGHMDCVQCLITNGADPLLVNANHRTPAQEAEMNRHNAVVEHLNVVVKEQCTEQGQVRNQPNTDSEELVSGLGIASALPPASAVNPQLKSKLMLASYGKTKSQDYVDPIRNATTPPLLKSASVESPTFPKKLHDNKYTAPSKQRVKLDKLSENLFTSLSLIPNAPGQVFKNPLLQTCRKMFWDFHMEYGFTSTQYESLMDTPLPLSQSYLDTSSTIHLHRDTFPKRKEWVAGHDYSVPDFKPLNQKPDGKREGVSSLVFKVRLLKPEMKQKHGTAIVIKMLINIIDKSTKDDALLYKRFQNKHWAEYSIQAFLPAHPNCMPLIHYYTGSTEDFLEQINSFIPESQMKSSEIVSTTTFMVMPACKQTLLSHVRQKMKENPISPFGISEDFILCMIAQMLLAVAHLQRHNIAHRDIKADNVFISEEDDFVLGDFGHAKALKTDTGERMLVRSKNDAQVGNAHAWSPEIHDHHRNSRPVLKYSYLDELYHKSDVHAVGRMVFHLFSKGQCNKFPSSDNGEIYYKTQSIPDIPTLSKPLNALLKNLVKSKPQDRFSALQGSNVAFVLLFLEKLKSIKSLDDCHKWIFSESMDIYLNGFQENDSSCDSKRSKIIFYFLSTTTPNHLWKAIEFVYQYL